MTGSLGIELTKDDVRPWGEKWWRVTASLEDLEEVYAARSAVLGSVRAEARAEAFFLHSNHLRDWIAHDPSNAVTIQDVLAFEKDPAGRVLETCRAICNTDKHHTITSNQLTARVRKTSVSASGYRIEIEIGWARPSKSTVDALDLARDCIAAWQAFFVKHGITPP